VEQSLVIDDGSAMIHAPLSEFSRETSPARAGISSRVLAGVLTAVLYALFLLLAWWSSTHRTPPRATEVTATLLRDVPKKRTPEPPPPFIAPEIRPQAEKPAMPVFTIATGAPPQAPAPLPATTQTSPMLGGTAGTGPMGQAASGNGTGGNGGALGGCLDPLWMRAVTERVRQYFYYPDAAMAAHTTGVVTMHFTVRRNGQIDRLAVGKSSGDDGLDRAAADIMRKAQPLPPIPDRMHVDRIEGEMPVNFGVRTFRGGVTAGHCGS